MRPKRRFRQWATSRPNRRQPLRTGIGLHEGCVFFGNVGGPERLDFTVIGRAVNASSRIEALTKSLKRSILISDPVARLLDWPLDHLGEHQLRSFTDPVDLCAPIKEQD
jgi:adenylate cyclase